MREATLNLGSLHLGGRPFNGAFIDFMVIALNILISMKQLKKAGLK